MAVQVMGVEKKKDDMGDGIMGAAKDLGMGYLKSKMGGAGGMTDMLKDAPKSGSGTSLGEQINAQGGSANQSSASSPRDRRMMRGY
jgi:hypothetical protein